MINIDYVSIIFLLFSFSFLIISYLLWKRANKKSKLNSQGNFQERVKKG